MQLARLLLSIAAVPLQYLDRPQITTRPPRGVRLIVYQWKRSVHFLFDEAEYWRLPPSTPQRRLQADAAHQWRLEHEASTLYPVLEILRIVLLLLPILLLFVLSFLLLSVLLSPMLGHRQAQPPALRWEPPHVPAWSSPESVRSLSRAAADYSLPWLARKQQPIRPPHGFPWYGLSRNSVFRQIRRNADDLEARLDEVYQRLGNANFRFFYATEATDIDPLLTLLSRPRPFLTRWLQPSRAEQSQLSTLLGNATSALDIWSDAASNTAPRTAIIACTRLILELRRLLDRAAAVVVESVVLNQTDPQGEVYGDDEDLHGAWLEHVDYLHTMSSWVHFNAMNLYVVEQRYSAMSFFASRISSTLQAEEPVVMSSRSAAREFCERLRRLLYRGKKSDLVTAASRAGLLASKFWAKKEEIIHKQAADILQQHIGQAAPLLRRNEWLLDVMFAYNTTTSGHGTRELNFYEPSYYDWSNDIPCPLYFAPRRPQRQQQDDKQKESIGLGHSDFSEDDEPWEKCVAFSLSARGFRSDQAWDRYKPQLNGERCVQLDVYPIPTAELHSSSSRTSPQKLSSQDLAHDGEEPCSPDGSSRWTTATTTSARCFVHTWNVHVGNASTFHDRKNNIWCVELPPAWETLLASEEDPVWLNSSSILLTFEPKERLLWDRVVSSLGQRRWGVEEE